VFFDHTVQWPNGYGISFKESDAITQVD
jgi:hypothetical protein